MATAYNDPQESYYMPPGQGGPRGPAIRDGKRMRKAIQRKTVDFSCPTVEYFETRMYQRDYRDLHALEPDPAYVRRLEPPIFWDHNPSTSLTTKFVHSSVNQVKCPINCVAWTPEGRRLITGASSGEFTLWNGFTFNFETILQAHDTAIRSMVWSHNDQWMVTGDHEGFVKYWQSNMNNVKAFSAHKEAVRDITFAPSDMKFATCSDDVSIKIWDFTRCTEEITLTGHGWDVKCLDWHPVTSLLASGSKDNLVKLWDPKSGKNLTTIHGHKNTILAVEWNKNGNWLLTGSRDQLLKIFDIRTMRELQTFRGHKKEVTSATWHPVHEDSFTSGGFDGSILFWRVGLDAPQAVIQNAHEGSIWDMAWHPLGHILCTGSNDHTTKFWCRNRPGDPMTDKYNEIKEEEKEKPKEKYEPSMPTTGGAIPGLSQSGTRRQRDDRGKERAPVKPPGSSTPGPMHIVPPPLVRGPGNMGGPLVFIPGASGGAGGGGGGGGGPGGPSMMPPFPMPPGGPLGFSERGGGPQGGMRGGGPQGGLPHGFPGGGGGGNDGPPRGFPGGLPMGAGGPGGFGGNSGGGFPGGPPPHQQQRPQHGGPGGGGFGMQGGPMPQQFRQGGGPPPHFPQGGPPPHHHQRPQHGGPGGGQGGPGGPSQFGGFPGGGGGGNNDGPPRGFPGGLPMGAGGPGGFGGNPGGGMPPFMGGQMPHMGQFQQPPQQHQPHQQQQQPPHHQRHHGDRGQGGRY